MSEEKKPVLLTQYQKDFIASALLRLHKMAVFNPLQEIEAKNIVDLMAEEN